MCLHVVGWSADRCVDHPCEHKDWRAPILYVGGCPTKVFKILWEVLENGSLECSAPFPPPPKKKKSGTSKRGLSKRGLGLRTLPRATGVSRTLRARNPKKVWKKSRKSSKSLEKVSKMSARDFFETFSSRLFGTGRLFGNFGPGGPRETPVARGRVRKAWPEKQPKDRVLGRMFLGHQGPRRWNMPDPSPGMSRTRALCEVLFSFGKILGD